MNTIDKLENGFTCESRTRAEAKREYLTLLKRNESPQAGDDERLSAVLDMLGLTVEDARRDLELLRQAAELEAASRPEPDRLSRGEGVSKALSDLADRIKAFKKATDAEQSKLMTELNGLHGEDGRRRDVTGRLMALKRSRPDLFPDATPAPAAAAAPSITWPALNPPDREAEAIARRQSDTRNAVAYEQSSLRRTM